MSALLDKVASLAEGWKKPISILSAIWFLVTVMAHARVIKLPELEILKGLPATLAAAAWNGFWWGYLRPQIEQRRASRPAMEMKNG